MVEKQKTFIASVLLVTLAWLGAAGAVWAQSYRLQPGDTLRAEITSIQGGGWSSTVDTDGFVRFPYLGRHQAAGKTLDTLTEDIVLSVVGRQVRLAGLNGETLIVLDEESLFFDIESYRPITVVGAVEAPGRLDYSPGLTVRAAIGMAGGVGLVQAEDVRPERLASLGTRLEELRKEEAWLMLDLWRIRGQLDTAYSDAPPSELARLIETRLPEDVIEDTRTRIAEANLELQRRFQDVADRVALSEERIDYLTRALEQYEVVSAGEEDRLARLLALQERGLTVANNVTDARAGALAASARLLQTEADLSETQRELRSLRDQRDGIESELRLDLLQEQAAVQRRLDEVEIRQDGVREELAMITGGLVYDETGVLVEPQVILYRRQRDVTVSQPVGLDDLVQPGDVLEVLLPGGRPDE